MQLSLFEPVAPITDKKSFFKNVMDGVVENDYLLLLCQRAFLNGLLPVSILPVDLLTSIPAWKSFTKPELHHMIQQSPHHNLYVTYFHGEIINASKNISELLNNHQIMSLYNYI